MFLKFSLVFSKEKISNSILKNFSEKTIRDTLDVLSYLGLLSSQVYQDRVSFLLITSITYRVHVTKIEIFKILT